MLARLVLVALQLAIAWFAGPEIVRYLPRLPGLQLFVYAMVFAAIVWVAGLVLAQVLRDARTPSSGTLVASLVVALIGAALVIFLPAFFPELGRVGRPIGRVDPAVYPLLGAVLGYHLRR